MKFGPLIEYNLENNFHENFTPDVMEKLDSEPFIKS